jgi:hypothetical protein
MPWLKPSTLRPGGEWQSGPMSALGQKQTYALQQAMSALPPKATLNAFIRMSAMGQKRTLAKFIRSPRRHVR